MVGVVETLRQKCVKNACGPSIPLVEFAPFNSGHMFCVVGVAQLVRALVCGAGGRGFETRHSPHISPLFLIISMLTPSGGPKRCPRH
jgi:hypothetical protein